VPQVRVYNKIDALGQSPGIQRDESGIIAAVRLCALTGEGCAELRSALAERFPANTVHPAAQAAPA
jgi:GTP-binding protein HflX